MFAGMMECLHNELKQFNTDVKTTNILPYFVETNPKVSSFLDLRYETQYSSNYIIIFQCTLHNIKIILYCLLMTDERSFRVPEIPTREAGSEMMKGILEEQRIFSVPGHMLTMVPIIR